MTFLFTDIEGSTRLWEQSPSAMSVALARHDALLREAIEGHDGVVFKTVGDAFCAAFRNPIEGLAAALTAQCALIAEPWPEQAALTIRMALHTGTAEVRDRDYFGQALNRVARLLAIGHGKQVLLSGAAFAAMEGTLPMNVSLLDRGSHRLKDLQQPENVFQLCHPELPTQLPPLRSLSTHPNNLPQQLTSFIGREKEIEEVKHLLSRSRLLTLTGSGGCGKTRLAMQVAADQLEGYPDGVWLAELAALADPGLVPQAVATVLGLKEERGKSLAQTLSEHLASRHLLLVLDNAEHLLAATAQLADAVLRQCPQVVLLVSSREGLGMAGELTYRVPSLPMPDPVQDATPERVSRYESVRLFVERAQFHVPQFTITEQNASALASVCYRLDGIPLALELAAARVRSLSVEEVNQRLDQRFRLLTGGSRTALPRQQTLRSLIDWSYDLLNPTEQELLRRLAVFSGGITLDAAEHVCSGEGVDALSMLDLLTSLADKSLLLPEVRIHATRYRMLETVRQYARDRLLDSGEVGRWRDRHLAYFLGMAEEAERKLTGADQKAWFDRLETEHDNLRSALTWSSAAGGDAMDGLRLAGALFQFWYVRGYFGEGRGVLSGVLAAATGDQGLAPRAKALHAAGALAWQQGDYVAAQALLDESLAIRRALGDRKGIATSLNNLGALAYDQTDYPTARARYEESLAIRRTLDDRWGIAVSLNNLGNVASEQDDSAAAVASYEASLAMFRELGDRRGVAYALNNLGLLASDRSDYAAARALHEESLAIRRELGDQWGIASSLNNLGDVVAAQGDFPAARALDQQSLAVQRALGDRRGIAYTLEALAYVASALATPDTAARIWGGAERLREEIGSPVPPSERLRYDRRVAAARVARGDDTAFDAAWREGRAMTPQQAIEHAMENQDR
ncbi:MAG: tetratricopeptide repeat protein [Betaproteobacteria bacterium]